MPIGARTALSAEQSAHLTSCDAATDRWYSALAARSACNSASNSAAAPRLRAPGLGAGAPPTVRGPGAMSGGDMGCMDA